MSTTPTPQIHTGRCLCGGVQYEVSGALRDIIACHCSQCRQTSGHYVAATRAASDHLIMTTAETLSWYRSSAIAERGFCNRCGGNLFWRPIGGTTTSIMAGTLDPPTHLRIQQHIYLADQSDYYTVSAEADR